MNPLTEPKTVVYDLQLVEYVWCPKSLFYKYYGGAELDAKSSSRVNRGFPLHGNKNWDRKPKQQKTDTVPTFMTDLVEMLSTSPDFMLEDTKLFDPTTWCLSKTPFLFMENEKFIVADKTYKLPFNVWRTAQIQFIANMAALRAYNLPAVEARLYLESDESQYLKFTPSDYQFDWYRTVADEARKIVEGIPSPHTEISSCPMCGWADCKLRDSIGTFKLVKDGTYEFTFG